MKETSSNFFWLRRVSCEIKSQSVEAEYYKTSTKLTELQKEYDMTTANVDGIIIPYVMKEHLLGHTSNPKEYFLHPLYQGTDRVKVVPKQNIWFQRLSS